MTAEASRADRIIGVGIAEYAVADGHGVLETSGLGSCVGVALHDPDIGLSGLAHIMLPSADGEADPGAKYADTGIETLLSAMECRGADRDRLVAKIAGGSDMFEFTSVDGSVGRRNVAATRTILDRLGIEIVGEDVRGSHGRSLTLRAGAGELVVRTVGGGERML